MASLAVRRTSKEDLWRGLVAIAAEGWAEDTRENLAVLSLLHDATIRLGLEPRAFFEQLRPYTSKAIADAVESFPARTPEAKTIAAMGYVVGSDADGFRYQRTW
jgi:hypothetical protein